MDRVELLDHFPFSCESETGRRIKETVYGKFKLPGDHDVFLAMRKDQLQFPLDLTTLPIIDARVGFVTLKMTRLKQQTRTFPPFTRIPQLLKVLKESKIGSPISLSCQTAMPK